MKWLKNYPDTQLRDYLLNLTICCGLDYNDIKDLTLNEVELIHSMYARKKEAELMPWCNLYALISNIMSSGKTYTADDFMPKRELTGRELEIKILNAMTAAGAAATRKN